MLPPESHRKSAALYRRAVQRVLPARKVGRRLRHTPHQQAVERRPRLLFLAYFFPPANAIACVRTWNIAKYLARLGWDITVVTLHPSIWRHTDNPEQTNIHLSHEGIRRILTDHRWRYLSPDHLKCWNRGIGWLSGGVCRRIARRFGINRELGWFKAAERACSTLTPDNVDIILASGDPFLAFKLAKLLSDRLRRPYVLDYRDPWTGNLHAAQPDRPASIQLEARLLSHAAAVTIVSRAWSIAMDQRFTLGSKLHVVTNGYDPDEMGRVRSHDFGHFAIVYTGSFYPPKRVISPVMEALARLKAATTESAGVWYFHYYGDQARPCAYRGAAVWRGGASYAPWSSVPGGSAIGREGCRSCCGDHHDHRKRHTRRQRGGNRQIV